MGKTALRTYSLKVLIPFYDMEFDGVKRLRNEEFECSEQRAKELLNYNYKTHYAIPGSVIRIVELIEIK